MALEDLERELWGAAKAEKSDGPKKRPGRDLDVVSEPPSFREKVRLVTRSVVLAAGVVLVVTGVVAGGLYLFFSREASRGIILTLEVPREVMSGVPFDLTVNAENEIDGIARDASVTLNLPQGVAALGVLFGADAVAEEPIGDIGGRTVAKKVFRLIAVGEPDAEKEIEVSLTYMSGGRSRFKANETATVTMGEPAVKVTAKAPDRVIGNSSFELELAYENTSSFDFSGVTLEVRYPTPFIFQSASLPPDSLNNYWRLGALNANSKGVLRVKGAIAGAGAGETSVTFPIVVAANFLGKDYAVLETKAEVALAPSPLILSLTVNGADDYIARAGDLLTYLLRYENRSGVALADVTLRATFTGEMFEVGSASTQGKVDSAARTVTWDATNVPSLRLLDAGASGEVVVAIPLRSAFPIRRLSDKNFTVKFTATAESPTVPSYLAADITSATAVQETKLSGQTLVDTQALYRDAPSGIVNAGALPPKVGEATEYTIHWIIKNYATDAENVRVVATLPPEVAWTGIVKSNGDSLPLFDESSREVTWIVNRIPATKGMVGVPLEAIFQVRATPTQSQGGNFVVLLSDTSLTATDMWTGVTLSSRDGALSTALEDDPTVAEGQGRVVP